MKLDYKNYFISQQHQPLFAEYGCGVASLLMLMKFAKLDQYLIPKWSDLCHELKLDGDHTKNGYNVDSPKIGLYPENLYRYLVNKDYRFRVHFYQHEWQSAITKGPIMVMLDHIFIEFPHEAHWVVLVAFDSSSNKFTYLDPWENDISKALKFISVTKFNACYSGLACQLL